MKRAIEWGALVLAFSIIVALGWNQATQEQSTYSTFDAGPNGYEALYNVLRSEGIPVAQLTDPLGLMSPNVRVLAVTPSVEDAAEFGYDSGDTKRLNAFVKRGGTVVAFGKQSTSLPKSTVYFDVRRFRNIGLEKHPAAVSAVYAAVAERGLVAFDERVQGYGTDRTLWSVLPPPVRTASWIVLLALLLALIGTNVRFAPAVIVEPPADRDSSDYIASMARLLRRARAPHVTFGKDHS